MEYNDRIKEYRARAGMTQQQLADRIGVTRQSVARWENGWNVPTLFYAQKLADVFGVSVSALMSGDAMSSETANADVNVDETCAPSAATPAQKRTHNMIFSTVWVCVLSVAVVVMKEIATYIVRRLVALHAANEITLTTVLANTLVNAICGILLFLLCVYWVLKLIKSFCACDDRFIRYREYRVWNVGLYVLLTSVVAYLYNIVSFVSFMLFLEYIIAAAITLPVYFVIKFVTEKALRNRMTVTRNRALDKINLAYSIITAVCTLALASFLIYAAVRWTPTDGLAVAFALLYYLFASVIIMLSYIIVRVAVRAKQNG